MAWGTGWVRSMGILENIRRLHLYIEWIEVWACWAKRGALRLPNWSLRRACYNSEHSAPTPWRFTRYPAARQFVEGLLCNGSQISPSTSPPCRFQT